MEATEKTPGIYTAMAAILADFPVVGKENKNPSQGYNYRGVDDAYAHLHPLLAKHGVFTSVTKLNVRFESAGETAKGKAQTRCILEGVLSFIYGADGSYVPVAIAGEGVDMTDKALMKARANAIKYAIWETFVVPTWEEEKDSEAFVDEPAAKKQRLLKTTTDVIKQIEETGTMEELTKLRPAALDYTGGLPANRAGDKEAVTKAFLARKEALNG